MNTFRASLLGLVLAVAGFAGAHALAAQSPPLVSNCVGVADGWAVEVLHIDCVAAGKLVRKLTLLAPKGPIRLANMTCTVGYAGKVAFSIRCAGGGGRFVRANLRPKGAKTTPLPPLLRCPDYVDKLRRRWALRSERFGCLDARDILVELASRRPTDDERDDVERRNRVGCWLNDGLPRELRCWRIFRDGHFYAHVRLAPTPSTTAATTTTEEP